MKLNIVMDSSSSSSNGIFASHRHSTIGTYQASEGHRGGPYGLYRVECRLVVIR